MGIFLTIIILATPKDQIYQLIVPVCTIFIIIICVNLAKRYIPLTLLMIAGAFLSFSGAALALDLLMWIIEYIDKIVKV
jgi:hypothetical protein